MAAPVSSASSTSSSLKPKLNFWQIWNISFGFFGVQIGYSLQNANTSRILSAIGADPHHLSLFWLAAPVAGLIVQPIVGLSSDKTWTRLGRRIPFILGGAFVSAAAMFFMPNSENFAQIVPAVFFGATMLLLMDTSFNVTMQPFRALVSDMVPEQQKNIGYSIQSFLINAGAVVGSLLPFVLTSIAGDQAVSCGKVSPTVIWSFYIGGFILLISVLWTSFRTKEYPPEEYAKYNSISEEDDNTKTPFITLLRNTPKRMFELGIVQFFSWFALFLMWVYTTNGISNKVWKLDPYEVTFAKNITTLDCDSTRVISMIPAIKSSFESNSQLELNGIDKKVVTSIIKAKDEIILHNKAVPERLYNYSELKRISSSFDNAGDWTGVIFAVYSVFAALFSLLITPLANRFGRKNIYALALLLGGIGLISMNFIEDKYSLIFPMIGVGIAWAAILALPYAILSSSLPPKQTGVYMGIFNATITIPQIVAGLLGGVALTALGGNAIMVIGLAGASMVIAGILAKVVIQSKD
jgi:maltose/moltooligosaccharide transporter